MRAGAPGWGVAPKDAVDSEGVLNQLQKHDLKFERKN